MTLTFSGINLSSFVTKYGFTETPRRVYGSAEGKAINGDIIDDTVAVKFDPTYELWPLTTAQMAQLWSLASLGMAQLRYTTPGGEVKTTQARMIVTSGASKVLETTSRLLYGGITIKFEVK